MSTSITKNAPSTGTLEIIKPCPFCGGEATVEEVDNLHKGVSFSVGCSTDEDGSCYGYQSLTTFARRSDAIAAWNKRAKAVPEQTQVALPVEEQQSGYTYRKKEA